MKIKKIGILIAISAISIFSFNLKASATTRNDFINPNMTMEIGDSSKQVSYSAWHYSTGKAGDGYWEFKRSDNSYVKFMYDRDIQMFFSGTSKILNNGPIKADFKIPSSAQKFVNVYGENKLGIKFDCGGEKSVLGNKINYKLNGNKIEVSYVGILNYVRSNMWQALNPSLVRKMADKNVYTPQVLEGYGVNKISIGDGGSGMGSGSIVVNPNSISKAYKDGKWLRISGEQKGKYKEYYSLWKTFTYGGNNGVYFYFPIKVKYFGMDLKTYAPTVANVYYDGSKNWVKVGEKFSVAQSGECSGWDDLVKITANHLVLKADNGQKTETNARIRANENYSKFADINNSNFKLKLESSSSTRVGNKVITNYELSANSEGKFDIGGYSRLSNYKKSGYNGEVTYKRCDVSNGATVYSDGTAPNGNKPYVSDITENTFKIRIGGVSDYGSGVGKLVANVQDGNNHKSYDMQKEGSEYVVTVNRSDLGDNIFDVKFNITLSDNVNNSRNISYDGSVNFKHRNIVAKEIKIYNPRENRYVSQMIKGLDYEAHIFIKNEGDLNVDNKFKVQLNKDNKYISTVDIDRLNVSETKKAVISFKATAEELRGNVFTGIADSDDVVKESNESDNRCDTHKPYDTQVGPNKQPSTDPNAPIITLILDLKADSVEIVDNKNVPASEIISYRKYKVKAKFSNQSSLPLKYIDILDKNFDVGLYIGNKKLTNSNFNDMGKGEVKEITAEFTAPDLDNKAEEVVTFSMSVDDKNNIYETDESNNIGKKDKLLVALRLEDYRVTKLIYPPSKYKFPIRMQGMPVSITAGYRTELEIDVLGKANNVYVDFEDTNGKKYDRIPMSKIRDINDTRSVYGFSFVTPEGTKDGTIFISHIYANKGTYLYNYNKTEKWDGNTFVINRNAMQDVVISRIF